MQKRHTQRILIFFTKMLQKVFGENNFQKHIYLALEIFHDRVHVGFGKLTILRKKFSEFD